jgi:phytanoyl-CoA hydroxylase
MDTLMKTDLQQAYDEKGYVIARNAIDADLAQETVDHVQWLMKKHPDLRPERLHHNLLANDPFMHRLVGDDRLLDIAEQFIGPNIVLFAAHYIAKKPETGQAVQWHQDGSYWPLEPMEVTTLWVAGTDSTIENGCMRVLPGTQNNHLIKRRELMELDTEKYVLGVGIRPDQIDESDAVDLELKAGDISIHNPNIIHGSNANTSDKWRVGLTLRYIPTSTWVNNEGHKSILLRGEKTEGIKNVYVERPQFVEGEHMSFRGCELWNAS